MPATWANGDETNAARPAKKAAIPPRTAATHGMSSRLRSRFWRSASADDPVSTASHRSSDPASLAQSELSV